ncbi:MAG: hypothetical protein J4O02_02475, partial [Chloroflexi bacterium]|nr:hypothetical protein [Chloroflexota bacterium]
MTGALAADLSRLIGSGSVSANRQQIERYSGDALGVYRAFRAAPRMEAKAKVVVWPTCTEHVSSILKYAQSS